MVVEPRTVEMGNRVELNVSNGRKLKCASGDDGTGL